MTDADAGLVRRILYMALDWKPDEELPPIEVVVEHPEVKRYHEGWGRAGDLGVAAEVDGEFVGGAFCRLFTEDDHGHGYVDPETPEVGVAVASGYRGQGIGGSLMDGIAELARNNSCPRLSLSVQVGNPAVNLYRRLGYQEVSTDDSAHRMVLEL